MKILTEINSYDNKAGLIYDCWRKILRRLGCLHVHVGARIPMRRIEIPELKFCPWFAWANRRNISQCGMPGVYVLSITNKNLEGSLPEWADVCYIGMTNSRQGLIGRWQQFFNSVRGKDGHSGGKTVFSDLGHYDSWGKKLFVAAMPVECNVAIPTERDLIRMGWVAYLEYEAFAEFHRHLPSHGKPEYNTR